MFSTISFSKYDYYVHYDYEPHTKHTHTVLLININLLNKYVIKFIYVPRNSKCVEALVRLIYESIDLYNYIYARIVHFFCFLATYKLNVNEWTDGVEWDAHTHKYMYLIKIQIEKKFLREIIKGVFCSLKKKGEPPPAVVATNAIKPNVMSKSEY